MGGDVFSTRRKNICRKKLSPGRLCVKVLGASWSAFSATNRETQHRKCPTKICFVNGTRKADFSHTKYLPSSFKKINYTRKRFFAGLYGRSINIFTKFLTSPATQRYLKYFFGSMIDILLIAYKRRFFYIC